jgi:hypothetical protein
MFPMSLRCRQCKSELREISGSPLSAPGWVFYGLVSLCCVHSLSNVVFPTIPSSFVPQAALRAVTTVTRKSAPCLVCRATDVGTIKVIQIQIQICTNILHYKALYIDTEALNSEELSRKQLCMPSPYQLQLLLTMCTLYFMSRWPTYYTYWNHADFPNVSVFPGDFEFSGIVCN